MPLICNNVEITIKIENGLDFVEIIFVHQRLLVNFMG